MALRLMNSHQRPTCSHPEEQKHEMLGLELGLYIKCEKKKKKALREKFKVNKCTTVDFLSTR